MAIRAQTVRSHGGNRSQGHRPTDGSWLSVERRNNILEQRDAVIDEYRKYKKAFENSLARPSDEEMLFPSWVTVRPEGRGGHGFSFGPKTAQCGYRTDTKGIGCYFCGLEAGSSIDRVATPDELVAQARRAYEEAKQLLGRLPITRVDIQGDGSYFDIRSFPRDGRIALLTEIASWPGIRKVMLETRFELMRPEVIIEALDILGPGKSLVLAGGVESADPFVSTYCVNKGLTNATIEKTFRMLAELNKAFNDRIEVNGYIMVKTAFLSDHEAIIDAVKTVQHLLSLSKTYGVSTAAKLEPSAISEGTLQGLMHEKGLYSALSYWSVLEILVRVRHFIERNCKVPVGGREDMDKFKDIAGNHTGDGRLDPTDAAVYYAVQEYNGHLSIDRILATICAAFEDDFDPLLDSIERWAATALEGEPSQAFEGIKQVIAEKKYDGAISREEQGLVSALCRVSRELTRFPAAPPVLANEIGQLQTSPSILISSITKLLNTFGVRDAIVHLRSIQKLPNSDLVQIATVVQTSNRTAPFWLMLPT